MNKLIQITQKENSNQSNAINLIASENYPSPKTLQLLGSVWNDKYAEGYPGKRYYAGNTLADELEEFVFQKALEVFDKTGEYGVNVQVLSGSIANAMVYLTVLESDDTVLSLDLKSGGHLSHLHSTSSYLKFFNFANYQLTSKKLGLQIDKKDFEQKIKQIKPRLVIIGFSSYPKKYEFAELCKIAHNYGSLVLADISHISGLIATENHDSPFKHDGAGADFVTTTTQKTLRGPRGALLFAKKEYMPAINKTVFPGTSGGPHLNQIAAIGQCLLEVLGQDKYPDNKNFNHYIENVLSNTSSLEKGLIEAGIDVEVKTQNHLVLINLPKEIDSLELQENLEKCGILTNRNAIKDDPKSPWSPSGMRLGTAALTSRGLDEVSARELGIAIGGFINGSISSAALKEFSEVLSKQLNWYL